MTIPCFLVAHVMMCFAPRRPEDPQRRKPKFRPGGWRVRALAHVMKKLQAGKKWEGALLLGREQGRCCQVPFPTAPGPCPRHLHIRDRNDAVSARATAGWGRHTAPPARRRRRCHDAHAEKNVKEGRMR